MAGDNLTGFSEDELFDVYGTNNIEDSPQVINPTGSISSPRALYEAMKRGQISYYDVRKVLDPRTSIQARRSLSASSGKSGTVNPDTRLPTTANLLNPSRPIVIGFKNYRHYVKPVPFYDSVNLKQTAASGRVILPVTPEVIEVSGSTSVEDVGSIGGVTFTHAGALAPITVAMDGFFPAASDIGNANTRLSYIDESVYTYGFYDAKVLCNKFTTAMRSGQPIIFELLKFGQDDPTLEEIIVTVVDFSWRFEAGQGMTRFFSMTLQEWFPQYLMVAKAKKKNRRGRTTQGTRTGNSNRSRHVPGEKYITRRGETLQSIADKKLGRASQWRLLWNYNKDTLNNELRRRGERQNNPRKLFPGTVLRIPPKAGE